MKNSFYQEIFISLVLVVLLVLFLNPFSFWMPNIVLMMLVLAFLVVFVAFASFVLREKARDEREGLHRMLAGRAAFLTGAGVLVIAIIIQSFGHMLDSWLVLILGVMVLTKIVGLIYSKIKN